MSSMQFTGNHLALINVILIINWKLMNLLFISYLPLDEESQSIT